MNVNGRIGRRDSLRPDYSRLCDEQIEIDAVIVVAELKAGDRVRGVVLSCQAAGPSELRRRELTNLTS